MKWLSLSWIFQLSTLLVLALANTETFLLRVPRDFPVGIGEVDNQYPLAISLKNSNHVKQTIETYIGEPNPVYVELQNLQVDETYQVKVCWTAVDPVAIDNLDWFIVPHSTEFQGTTSKNARIFIKFSITNDSYPVMQAGSEVPVNVSVINCKLGVPVDLYNTIIYLIILTTAVVFLNRKYSLYDLIRY